MQEEKFNEYTEKDNGIAFVLDMNARLFILQLAAKLMSTSAIHV